MSIRQFIWVAVFVLGLPSFAVDWKAESAKTARWIEKTSGKMTITQDPKEGGAVRFDTVIEPGKAPWIYPLFQLKENESLEGAAEIRFEIKVETEEKPTFSCVMLDGKMLPYRIAVGRWKRVRVSLRKDGLNLKKAKSFQIGFNPAKAGKSTFWIRNFEVVDQAQTDSEKLTVASVNWKKEAGRAERWSKNSSGRMEIAVDPNENDAIRFDTEIDPGKKLWIYPVFQLDDDESLDGAAEIRFEIKAETEGTPGFACVMVGGKMLPYRIAVGRWKRVRVSLRKDGLDLKKAKSFQIGFNPAKAGKSTFWIRNFEVVDQARVDSEKPTASAVDWKKETARMERWTKNASGVMTISRDPLEKNAVRFDTEIEPGKGPWVYPVFSLDDDESLADAEELRFEIKVKAEGTPGFACVMAAGKMLTFPAPTRNWESVKVSLRNPDIDLNKVKAFQIGFNPLKTGKSTMWLRNIEVIDRKTAEEEKKAVPIFLAAKSTALSNVFYDTETVTFMLKEPYRSNCSFRIEDAFGKEFASGIWPDNGRGNLVFKNVPRGYYTLMLYGKQKKAFREPLSFAVVAHTRPNPESYFGIDTAQSWLCTAYPDARHPTDKFELVSELCRRAGVGIIRERLSWADVEKKPGQINWDRYMRNAEYLQTRGIVIDGLYIESVPWAKNKNWKFPDDLLAVYNFSKRAGIDFKGKMVSWEFWNEPDGHINGPAWELTASTKASSLGFRAADPNLLLLNGSFCTFPLRNFVEVALENDMLDYLDAFNYHIYKELAEYPAVTKHLRDILIRFGAPEMPVWITENGTRVEGMGTADSYRPGLKIHSPKQEMIVAEFLPKGQILLQMLGIARNFFFVLPAFNEGRKDWGLMRRDQTVKPGYAAFANLQHQIAEAVLLGEINLAKNVRAFLYEQKNGSQTLVLWSESNIDRPDAEGENVKVEIAQPTGKYQTANLFGTVSSLFSENGRLILTATRYPVYINGLRGLKADRKPTSPGRIVRRNNKELSVILRPVLGKDFMIAGSESAELLTPPSGKMTLQVWNLSPEAKKGTLEISGAKVEGLPDQVSLKPFEKKEIALTVTPKLPDHGYKGKLVFGGTFSGKPVSRSVVPLLQIRKMPSVLLDYRNPAKWNPNSSGKMEITYDKGEDAIRFRTTFKRTDRWIYPEYIFAPSESLKNAAGVIFEIKANKKDISHGLFFSSLMAVLDSGKDRWLMFSWATDQWETRIIPFESFNPEQLKKLRIGMNPNCNDFTYFIRNLKIYYDLPEKQIKTKQVKK